MADNAEAKQLAVINVRKQQMENGKWKMETTKRSFVEEKVKISSQLSWIFYEPLEVKLKLLR